jgi:peroxiredoxin
MRVFVSSILLVLTLATQARADLRTLVVTTIKAKPGKKGVTFPRETLKLDSVIGKRPVVILYWNPAVAASVEELKRFDWLAKSQAGGKVLYLSAARAMDDNEIDWITDSLRENNLSIPVLLDQQLSMGQMIKAQFLPAFYGVSASGQENVAGFGSLLDLTADGKTLEMVLAQAQKDLPLIRPAPIKEPAVNDFAPDFTLPDLKGTPVRLSSFRGGKNVLLIFWSAYCPHCQKELPRIQAYLKARRFPYTAISVTRVVGVEDRAVTEGFVRDEGIEFPVLVDGGQVLAKYQVKGIPEWMILDPQGKIITIQTGEKPGLEGLLQHWEK